MNYLYHWVPEDMRGNILYPLNVLKEKYPELYAIHAEKYVGREKLMQRIIPTLNCLWNDVIHLTVVHPKVVKNALIEAGSKGNFEMMCYEIDPYLLDPDITTVYLYKKSEKRQREDFTSFNPEEIKKYSLLPQETKDYYKETYEKGGKPLVFHKVVHILYKGSLPVENLSIVRG